MVKIIIGYDPFMDNKTFLFYGKTDLEWTVVMTADSDMIYSPASNTLKVIMYIGLGMFVFVKSRKKDHGDIYDDYE